MAAQDKGFKDRIIRSIRVCPAFVVSNLSKFFPFFPSFAVPSHPFPTKSKSPSATRLDFPLSHKGFKTLVGVSDAHIRGQLGALIGPDFVSGD